MPFQCSGKQKIVQTILTNEEEEIGKAGIRLWPGPGSMGEGVLGGSIKVNTVIVVTIRVCCIAGVLEISVLKYGEMKDVK